MSKFENDVDIEFLKQVIEYNHNRYISFKEGIVFNENKEFEKVLNARRCKISRIQRRLVYLLTRYDYIWFCTFTFSDDYINKCDRSKRDLIKLCINSYDFKYILNIDYGKTTEREHYHCVLGTNFNLDIDKLFKEKYPCFSFSINCKKGKSDYKRLSKYINKLTNHCIKATTKRQRLVYNFKGYDFFCSNNHDATIFYHIDRELL